MIALRDASVAGVGVVQLPHMMIGNELSSGKLLRLLPGWAPRPDIAHAVFASRRGLLPSVRALIDFLAERFAALKDQ
jgi:DNA-binding transcriptional LysR family regulator